MYSNNENKIAVLENANLNELDELERILQEDLENSLADVEFLKEQAEQINNPEALGEVVLNVVWEQFNNQVGIKAGEDFIKGNNGLYLDLSDDAHIQTTENFAAGNIATHNTEIDYQERYEEWRKNFKIDENGDIVTHTTRSGKEEPTLTGDARKPYDAERPKGSKEEHQDHTISAGEIIRDPGAAAHMTEKERVGFANSSDNLHSMPSDQNQSKGDKPMSEWLDNPNSKGQKPKEIFDISDEKEAEYRQKDEKARKEFERRKKEAEDRSIEAGKKSQKDEAFRIGTNVARAAVMTLLAELAKEIFRGFVRWIKSAGKTLESLLESVEDAFLRFIRNLKTTVVNIADTAATTIATSIIRPIVGTLKKAWMFIKQGWNSIKELAAYIKNPNNRNKPLDVLLLEVSKIITVGFTAAGAIVLSEVIEKGLMTIPVFAIEIPLLGSIANIVGIFSGAVVAGIVGAIALNLINRLIAEKKRRKIDMDIVGANNEVLEKQEQLKRVASAKAGGKKDLAFQSMAKRREELKEELGECMQTIYADDSNDREAIEGKTKSMDEKLDKLLS